LTLEGDLEAGLQEAFQLWFWDDSRVVADSSVGAGLPAIAVCQPLRYWLWVSYRRQASSHIWICVHLGYRGNFR